jgi:hypothetical protein
LVLTRFCDNLFSGRGFAAGERLLTARKRKSTQEPKNDTLKLGNFAAKEGRVAKSKYFLAFGLLVIGCGFASAQTFGFASTGGGIYCNYIQLSYSGGGLWGGFDNFSVCGGAPYSTISGFSASVSKKSGNAVYGDGVIYGDSIYAASSGEPQDQWTVFTKLKCNKLGKDGHYTGDFGWIGVAAFSGVFGGTSYGYLTCTIPSKTDGDAIMRGPTMGRIKRPKR